MLVSDRGREIDAKTKKEEEREGERERASFLSFALPSFLPAELSDPPPLHRSVRRWVGAQIEYRETQQKINLTLRAAGASAKPLHAPGRLRDGVGLATQLYDLSGEMGGRHPFSGRFPESLLLSYLWREGSGFCAALFAHCTCRDSYLCTCVRQAATHVCKCQVGRDRAPLTHSLVTQNHADSAGGKQASRPSESVSGFRNLISTATAATYFRRFSKSILSSEMHYFLPT